MTVVVHADLRPALGPVRNQGRRPTCLAFATSAAHGHAQGYQGSLCVEWLYYHAVKRAGDGPADGSTVEDTRAVLATIGQPDEAFWPYQPLPPDPTAWGPLGPANEVLRCGSALCQGELADLRHELDAGRPVVLALSISDVFVGSWEVVSGEALLRDDDAQLEPGRGHAVVAVGYGRVRDESCFLIRNSWGSRWGQNGHAWVRDRYVARRLLGAFIVRHGTRDVLQPETTSGHGRTRLA